MHSSIEPGNNACGGPGLWSDVAAPAIITTASFSPVMIYVWEVSKTMRNTYSTGCVAGAVSCPGGSCQEPSANEAACLPVEVDLGVLLGWAYIPSADDVDGQCNGDTPNYALDNNYDGQSTVGSYYSWEALDSGNPNPSGLDSLYFDVSCSVSTAYRTVPLGPASDSQQNNSIGNPGTPYKLPLTLNIPFAPVTAAQ